MAFPHGYVNFRNYSNQDSNPRSSCLIPDRQLEYSMASRVHRDKRNEEFAHENLFEQINDHWYQRVHEDSEYHNDFISASSSRVCNDGNVGNVNELRGRSRASVADNFSTNVTSLFEETPLTPAQRAQVRNFKPRQAYYNKK